MNVRQFGDGADSSERSEMEELYGNLVNLWPNSLCVEISI